MVGNFLLHHDSRFRCFQARISQKKQERAEQEKKEQIQREKIRRAQGKDMSQGQNTLTSSSQYRLMGVYRGSIFGYQEHLCISGFPYIIFVSFSRFCNFSLSLRDFQ